MSSYHYQSVCRTERPRLLFERRVVERRSDGCVSADHHCVRTSHHGPSSSASCRSLLDAREPFDPSSPASCGGPSTTCTARSGVLDLRAEARPEARAADDSHGHANERRGAGSAAEVRLNHDVRWSWAWWGVRAVPETVAGPGPSVSPLCCVLDDASPYGAAAEEHCMPGPMLALPRGWCAYTRRRRLCV